MLLFTSLAIRYLVNVRNELIKFRGVAEKHKSERTLEEEEFIRDGFFYMEGFWKPIGNAAWLCNLRLMGRICDEVREINKGETEYRSGKDWLGISRLVYRNALSALRGWIKISILGCSFVEMSNNARVFPHDFDCLYIITNFADFAAATQRHLR